MYTGIFDSNNGVLVVLLRSSPLLTEKSIPLTFVYFNLLKRTECLNQPCTVATQLFGPFID